LQTSAATLADHPFELNADSEVTAVVRASCERCDWGVEGREAAVLTVSVDGRYSQHITLTRGEALNDYAIALGRLTGGRHVVHIARDESKSAPGTGRVQVASIDVRSIDAVSPDALGLSMSPILHARPNTVGRFTDVPLLMWYEIVPTGRGRQFRYSVIFSNEDGGTPTDRLMATWGRTTDIEFVYGVELDRAGHVVSEEYQGPEHKILPVKGAHEGRHPLLWVATDNNMVKDEGAVEMRYAPAPVAFDLSSKSREAVMDANGWTYGVMARELRREGKIVEGAAKVPGAIPDLRRFIFVEACTDLDNAAVSFAVRAGGRWYESDRGSPEFRVVRTGCFRGAVAIDVNAAPDAVRFSAHPKPVKAGDPPPPAGRVRLTRVNSVFELVEDYTPGTSRFSWTGGQDLVLNGAALELPFAR
jgi:hypothetical protein